MSDQYKRYLEAKTRVFYYLQDNVDRGDVFKIRDATVIALLRRNVDMIVLCKTESNLQEWKIVQSEYGYLDSQVIWLDSDKESLYSTTEELEEVFSIISSRFAGREGAAGHERVTSHERVTGHEGVTGREGITGHERVTGREGVLIVPRVVSPEFMAVCKKHNFDYVGTCVYQYQGKSDLHDNESVKDALNFENLGVDVTTLKGVTGNSRKSLLEACKYLYEDGVGKAIFKPKHFQGGDGVQILDLCDGSRGASDIPTKLCEKEWVLEEFIENVQMTIGISCWGINVLSITDQIQTGFRHTGNRFPSTLSAEVQETCKVICQKLALLLDIDCLWGTDIIFYANDKGKPNLSVVDLNMARFGGGHHPILYAEAHGIDMKFWLAAKSIDSTLESNLKPDKLIKKPRGCSTYIWYVQNGC